jgi:UDP-glucose 4-epimerase
MIATPVLVTGSSGAIGTALCKTLLSDGYEIVGVDTSHNRWSDKIDDRTIISDIQENPVMDALPEDIGTVVHLAANSRVQPIIENPALANENLNTTFSILEYARTINANVVFASSREVYGDSDIVLHNEVQTDINDAHNPYAASKVGGEALAKSYEQCYDIDTTILRLSNVYGRYDTYSRVVPLFITKAVRGHNITVYGSNKILDFVYIDDVIDALMRTIRGLDEVAGSTFNIGSGQGTSLIELANCIADTVKADISVNIEEKKQGEMSQFVADISKAQHVLDYEPEYNLRSGIDATVDWYQSRSELFDCISN